MPPQPPKKKPAAEPVNWTARILIWGFVIAVIGGIVWMVATAPKQKPLVCKGSVGSSASLRAFGTCVEE